MTISTGFLAKSATVAGVALAGVATFGLSEGGTPIDLRSDGELYPKIVPIIPAPPEVEIETKDLAAAISPGVTGILSLVADKMVGGKTLSGTITVSATLCTVLSVSRGTDINGTAVLRITARVQSADGATSGLTIASA